MSHWAPVSEVVVEVDLPEIGARKLDKASVDSLFRETRSSIKRTIIPLAELDK